MNSTKDEQVWIEKYRAALAFPAEPAKTSLGLRVMPLLTNAFAAVKSKWFKKAEPVTTSARRPSQSARIAEITDSDLKSEVMWRISVNAFEPPRTTSAASQKAG